MMEAMPAFGPGITTGGGCDFRCSLSSGIMNRMGTEQAIKVQATDLATAKSELGDIDPIGIYRLFVGETTYKNKITGDIVTETTLLSPTSNNEGPGVWTDAGEHGTGTKEEYQGILDRARELANTEGAATIFWVSPAKEKRTDGAPEHRAYLWQKNEKGEVTAYTYQLTGSIDSLAKTFTRLSTGASFFDTQSLMWRSNSDTISHKKIFDAYRSSLTREEREKAKDFLDRFQQETVQSDSVLSERIEKYKEQYEQQLREVYTGDIESAVEKVAQGFLALQRQEQPVDAVIQNQKDHISYLPGGLHSNQLHQDQGKQIISTQKATTSILPIVLPKETENDPSQSTNTSIEEIQIHYIQETLEPFIPAVITVLSHLAGDELVLLELLSEESVIKTENILFSESDTTFDGGLTQEVHSLETVLEEQQMVGIWQDFFALLFSPNEQDGIEIVLSDEISQDGSAGEREETSVLFSALFSDAGMEQVLDGVENTTDTEEDGERIPQEIETEILDVAKDILTLPLLFSEKNPFLSLYADKKTTPEMKELLALFLYQEIELLGKEHISLSENIPYLTFMKEMSLYKPLLEKRKAVLTEKLWQLLSAEIENNHYINPKSKRKIETLLFLLYALHKNEPEKISSLIVVVEQLKKSVSGEGGEDTMDGYLFQLERLLVSRQKKPSYAAPSPKRLWRVGDKASEGKAGIIYWFWQNEYYRLMSLSVVNGCEK